MSGHTPGPWHVEDPMGDGVEDDLWIVVGNQFYNWRCLALASCDTETGPTERAIYRPQRDANARLIAAAPELLTCGSALLEAAERHIFGDECKAEREAMRAAIAKATGQ